MDHIQIIPSTSLLKVMSELSSVPDSPFTLKTINSHTKSTPLILTTPNIKWYHTKIKEKNIPHRIHQLLNESKVILPAYQAPPRSPELERRIERLRAQQSNREYRQMTKNLIVDQYEAANLRGIGNDLKEFNSQLREMNRQLVTGAQYLVSIIGTFFAVFMGMSYVLDEYATRLLLAMFCAIIVGIAEIYFIIRHDIFEEQKIEKKDL